MASGGLSTDNGLNVTKVLLAFLSIVYDLIYCVQNYCLYRHATHIIEQDPFQEELLLPKLAAHKF